MTIEKFRVYTTSWEKTFLRWEYGFTLDNLANCRVEVRRGESEFSLVPIADLAGTAGLYEDDTIGSYKDDKFFWFHYQLALYNSSGELKFETEILHENQSGFNWVEKEVARRDYILYSNFGNEFIWYAKKGVGTLCSCYDITLGQKIKPGPCYECYETTIVGGYYDPVLVKGKMGNYQHSPKMGIGGVTSSATTSFNMASEPTLIVGDLIVDNRGNRWEIAASNNIHIGMSEVKQSFRVEMVDRTHPVYSLPIDFSLFSEYNCI